MDSWESNETLLTEAGTGRDSVWSDSVALGIVSHVAAVEGVDPTELPSLSEAIDTDAIELLFQRPKAVERACFEYCGRRVEVRPVDNTGRVVVSDS